MSDIGRDWSFGGIVFHERITKKITLRELAKRLNSDAGNISKLERGELDPPKKSKKIEDICKALENEDLIPLLKSVAFQHHIGKLKQEFDEY